MAESDPIDVPADVPAEEVDALYGLPFEEFVPARDALAARLRAANARPAAEWVRRLTKPSLAAWAANQVLRTQRREATALLEAGRALRAAQKDALAGRGARGLAEAARQEREAVAALTRAASGLLRGDGRALGPTVLDRVRETLHAGALDEDARLRLEVGRLSHERRAVGLGALGGDVPAAPTTTAVPSEPAGDRRAPRRREGGRKAAAERGRPAADAAERARAEAEAERARREQEAEAIARRAETALAEADDRLARARGAEEAARRALEAATAAHAQAREELGQAEDERAGAAAGLERAREAHTAARAERAGDRPRRGGRRSDP